MKDLVQEHISKYGIKPVVIGMFFNDVDKVIDGIADAVEGDKPYNEYELLTDEEKKLYDEEKLVF